MSAAQKFTPGPWEIGSGFGLYGVRIDASDRAICGVIGVTRQAYNRDGSPAGEVDMPDGWANARLIAAAPDLYAVVEELEESASYWSEYCVPIGIVDRLRAALAKARGDA